MVSEYHDAGKVFDPELESAEGFEEWMAKGTSLIRTEGGWGAERVGKIKAVP